MTWIAQALNTLTFALLAVWLAYEKLNLPWGH